jgi:hypothetical protein
MDFSVNDMEPENVNTLQTQSCLKGTLLLLLLLYDMDVSVTGISSWYFS